MALLIFLIIFVSIIGFMLLIYLMDVAFILVFKEKMKRRAKNISLILTQKNESLESIVEILKENSIDIDSNLLRQFNEIDQHLFIKVDSDVYKYAFDFLSLFKMTICSVANKNPKISKDQACQLNIDIINTLDKQLRTASLSYNSYVVGYNYWVDFIPCSLINKAFGLKKANPVA